MTKVENDGPIGSFIVRIVPLKRGYQREVIIKCHLCEETTVIELAPTNVDVVHVHCAACGWAGDA